MPASMTNHLAKPSTEQNSLYQNTMPKRTTNRDCALGLVTFAALLIPLPAATAQEVPDALVANIDKGDTVWMLLSTALVVLMTLPGLALFYGGLVRSKNVLSILMQVFAGFALMALLWVSYGYSLAFGGTAGSPFAPFIGDFSKLFLNGVTPQTAVATFSENVMIPELTFVLFQLTFAGITPALIVGAVAERVRFGPLMIFLALWFTLAYLPLAHMVWAETGLLFNLGALDFAGGTVVHINAGIAGLVAAIMIGPRKGFLKDPMAPHNLTFTMIGASLLWVGWFGFNAGSNLEATGLTAQAMLNTITAASAGALTWAMAERITKNRASLLGAVSGAVSGLVAITPAAGLAGTFGAILLGGLAGIICLWAVTALKPMFNYDDSLDVFGIHGIGGIIGALGTAVVALPALGGYGADDLVFNKQLIIQTLAVVIAIAWSGIVSICLLLVIGKFTKLRVDDLEENDGLDLSTHGERAYN